jgi:RNA polymerase sigma-70 factor (ECF subfamily)
VSVNATEHAARNPQDVPADRRLRFESEVTPYRGQLYRSAVRLTRDHCDAEDLLQETLARAYLKFDQFCPGTNLRAWLYRIMFGLFYSGCRARRRRPPEVLTPDLHETVSRAGTVPCMRSAEAEAVEQLADSEIMRALSELPECFKTVLCLADIEGYRCREIADIMRIPLGTVMSRRHRGRRLLRAKLQARQIAEIGQPRGRDAARAGASQPEAGAPGEGSAGPGARGRVGERPSRSVTGRPIGTAAGTPSAALAA